MEDKNDSNHGNKFICSCEIKKSIAFLTYIGSLKTDPKRVIQHEMLNSAKI
jgi:hypothetical protein